MLKRNRESRHITQPFIIVGCLISDSEGKILLLHEGGKWNLPAGWLELGEALADGAKREAEEETGQETKINRLIGVYSLVKHRPDKTLHAVKFMFEAHFTGKSLERSESIPFQWFTLEEMGSLRGNFWDNDVPRIVADWKKCGAVPIGLIQSFMKSE